MKLLRTDYLITELSKEREIKMLRAVFSDRRNEMMMTEKICFMQFYEIDITWQMTLAFDFFFPLYFTLPPYSLTKAFMAAYMQNRKRKIILTFCHRCRRHCRLLKDEEKIGH